MFSKATEYALRATIYLAKKSSSDKKIGILYNNSCSTFQDILNILQNKIIEKLDN